MKKYSTGLMALCMVAVLFVGLLGGALIFPTEKTVLETQLIEVAVPYVIEVQSNDSRLDSAINQLLEEDDVEEFAEEFALEELESNDFTEAIFDALLLFGEDVDDEEDVYKYVVKDLDISVSGESADVEFSIKVYYYVDGDDEETEKALLEDFTMELDDLDVDEDFDDAEVDEAYLSSILVKKVY